MHRLRRVFAAVALAVVVAPLLASAPLFDPDEGLHAAIAQEMVQRGDYVTPTFLGEPFLDKPILFFWAEAASLRLFGHNEAAVRIPPLLFGLLGMLGVALLGGALFGEAAGLSAGIVYATMLLPMGVSEVAVHDVGLVPFLCVAAWCLYIASETPVSAGAARKVVSCGVLAGVCLGLSILTKGLVGAVFAGIFAAVLAVHRPGATARLAGTLAVAGIVAALVAAPWYVAMEHAHPGYLHYYFVERHMKGYLTATQRHAGRGWWYYVPIVLGGALPWTLYLAAAARSARQRPLRLVLWGWFGIGLVFLSIGESKLVTYALPLFAPLGILIGEALAARTVPPGPDAHSSSRWLRAGPAAHIAAAALLPLAGLVAVQWKYGARHPYLWPVVLTLSLLAVGAGRRAIRSPAADGFIAWIACATLLSFAAMMVVVPRAAAWMTARELAAVLNTAGALPPRVSVLDERIGSLVFYLDPPLRAEASRERLDESSFSEAIARVRVDPDAAVLAVRNTRLERFNRLFARTPVPDARAGTFTLFRARALRAALGGR